jgi:hypothetical protein
MIHRVYNAHGPGPHDDNFSCVETLKLFKAPDGHVDLCGRTEKLWQKSVPISNMHLRASLCPSLVDKISSQEVKFERRRWFRHKSDDANSIRTTAAIIGS